MKRDPALLAECRALVKALAPYPTSVALRASAEWTALEKRFDRLLNDVWRYAPQRPAAEPVRPSRGVRAVHWNIEHGNWYDKVESALLEHTELRGADLVMCNEVDVGCARSANRDVTADLSRALGFHAAWVPMFLESTLGRDDDAASAAGRANEEGMVGLAVLSRWPIRSTRLIHLPGPESIQFDLERMFGHYVGLVVEIERPEGTFVAVGVHLEVHRTRDHRTRQMELLLEGLRGEDRPIVLAGDFNTHTFDRGLWHTPLSGASALLLQPGRSLQRRLLHPDLGPDREPLFDALRREGFDWERYVDYEPTLDLRMDRLEEAGPVFRMLGPLGGVIRRWSERRGQLRLDWFAGRGWKGGSGHTVRGLDGPGHAADHAPIVAEFL